MSESTTLTTNGPVTAGTDPLTEILRQGARHLLAQAVNKSNKC
jgi:hypothetical protein